VTLDAPDEAAIERYWSEFLATRPDLPPDLRYYEASPFGNTAAMADELAAVVCDGTKTTTSGLLWGYEAEGLQPMQAGDLSIVLNGAGSPVCITETVAAWIMPFDQADERFAYEYGEGDRTLAWWREHLWDYYAAECDEHGWQPAPDMPLVCERFRVVYRG
jgi:uncharacterized protein YhfF